MAFGIMIIPSSTRSKPFNDLIGKSKQSIPARYVLGGRPSKEDKVGGGQIMVSWPKTLKY
jgi:hypothetical protein